jgi:hypothetical protein
MARHFATIADLVSLCMGAVSRQVAKLSAFVAPVASAAIARHMAKRTTRIALLADNLWLAVTSNVSGLAAFVALPRAIGGRRRNDILSWLLWTLSQQVVGSTTVEASLFLFRLSAVFT